VNFFVATGLLIGAASGVRLEERSRSVKAPRVEDRDEEDARYMENYNKGQELRQVLVEGPLNFAQGVFAASEKLGEKTADSAVNFATGVGQEIDEDRQYFNFAQAGEEALSKVTDKIGPADWDQGLKCAEVMWDHAAAIKANFKERGWDTCDWKGAKRWHQGGRWNVCKGPTHPTTNIVDYCAETWCPANGVAVEVGKFMGGDLCSYQCKEQYIDADDGDNLIYKCGPECDAYRTACEAVPGCAFWKGEPVGYCGAKKWDPAYEANAKDLACTHRDHAKNKKALTESYKDACIRVNKEISGSDVWNGYCGRGISWHNYDAGGCNCKIKEFEDTLIGCTDMRQFYPMLLLGGCDPRARKNAKYKKNDWTWFTEALKAQYELDFCNFAAESLLGQYGIDISSWPLLIQVLAAPVLIVVVGLLEVVSHATGSDLSATIRF